jgi:hypothetical protein
MSITIHGIVKTLNSADDVLVLYTNTGTVYCNKFSVVKTSNFEVLRNIAVVAVVENLAVEHERRCDLVSLTLALAPVLFVAGSASEIAKARAFTNKRDIRLIAHPTNESKVRFVWYKPNKRNKAGGHSEIKHEEFDMAMDEIECSYKAWLDRNPDQKSVRSSKDVAETEWKQQLQVNLNWVQAMLRKRLDDARAMLSAQTQRLAKANAQTESYITWAENARAQLADVTALLKTRVNLLRDRKQAAQSILAFYDPIQAAKLSYFCLTDQAGQLMTKIPTKPMVFYIVDPVTGEQQHAVAISEDSWQSIINPRPLPLLSARTPTRTQSRPAMVQEYESDSLSQSMARSSASRPIGSRLSMPPRVRSNKITDLAS